MMMMFIATNDVCWLLPHLSPISCSTVLTSFFVRRYYFARDDETPAKIAAALGVDCKLFVRLNKTVHAGLTQRARLNEGCHLFIPGKSMCHHAQLNSAHVRTHALTHTRA